MQQPPIDQLLAEIVQSFGEALGLVTAAIARQGDAEKLRDSLQAQIHAATSTRAVSPLSIRLAKHALAGIEAECLARQSEKDQAKH